MADCIAQILQLAEQQLQNVSDSARLDAEVLLAMVLNKNRSYFRAFAEQELTTAEQLQFLALLDKRSEGQPIAHITGHREFWSLDLTVNEHTLIPRPDTEVIIEFILHHFPQDKLRLADLGTGSGAIALALASEKPQWEILATDQSAQALTVAQNNALKHQLTNVCFKQGSWFEPLGTQPFDIIISNPPYIPERDPHLLQGDVRFEPMTALASGTDGLDDIRHLIKHAKTYLQTQGWLILEHGYDQQAAIYQLFQQAGFMNIRQRNDYADNPRMTAGQYIRK
ncbi:MAG: peptide chain release factor N(5)-glutamine methyltransferase [Gammaproteobacteria bacterium]|nr:peptide chain release factor N(5)-glutamine methyltransferase [Gammaproteobacteria bacterium]